MLVVSWIILDSEVHFFFSIGEKWRISLVCQPDCSLALLSLALALRLLILVYFVFLLTDLWSQR